MTPELSNLVVSNGQLVEPAQIPVALTAGNFVFDDGASQVFATDGTTVYTERGRPSNGTWYVEGENFCSFWPPSYTGCYKISWIVEAGSIVGLSFADVAGPAQFDGRYTN